MEEENKTMSSKKAHEGFWAIGMLVIYLAEARKLSKERQKRLMDALSEVERVLFPYPGSRKKSEDEDMAFISTPMPGKVVKILVKEGDRVKGGDTVVVVSAMKMESEYKVIKDRLIKKVLVKEGDNIEGDQPLIMLE